MYDLIIAGTQGQPILDDDIKELKINWKRVATTSMFGFGFVGPVGHYWYEYSDRFVRHRLCMQPQSMRFVLTKVATDAIAFGPLDLVLFFSYMGLSTEMEKEVKNQNGCTCRRPDFPLRWGKRARIVFVRVKDGSLPEKSEVTVRKNTASRADFRASEEADEETSSCQPLSRNTELGETLGSSSSEKREVRYFPTRASIFDAAAGKTLADKFDEKSFDLPKFFSSLSCKEKEEDFMAIKGCKLPQRPKKRWNSNQKSILGHNLLVRKHQWKFISLPTSNKVTGHDCSFFQWADERAPPTMHHK